MSMPFSISTKGFLYSAVGAIVLCSLTYSVLTHQENRWLSDKNQDLQKILLEQQSEYEVNLTAAERELSSLRSELQHREKLFSEHSQKSATIQVELDKALRAIEELKEVDNEVKTWSDNSHPNVINGLLNPAKKNNNEN